MAVDVKKLKLDVEVLPGYATDLPADERMMAYDMKGRLLNIEQMGWRGITNIGPSRFRLTTASLRRPECNGKTCMSPCPPSFRHAHRQRETTRSVPFCK